MAAFFRFEIMFSNSKQVFSSCLSYSVKDHLAIWFFVLLHESFYLIFGDKPFIWLLWIWFNRLASQYYNIFNNLVCVSYLSFIVFFFFFCSLHHSQCLGLHVHSVHGRINSFWLSEFYLNFTILSQILFCFVSILSV